MNNFIPPVKGTKLGEFEPTWLKRLYYYWIADAFGLVINIIWRWGVLVALPVGIGFRLMKDPFNPEWASWIVAIILCLIGVFFGIFQVYDFFNDTSRKTIKISEKKLSLFLVDNGVEINEIFIPFKDTDYSSKNFSIHGIVSFKLDGEYLLIKTVGKPFILYYYELNENNIKFKIESKYHFCKEELLSYLNNIIPQN